MVRFGKNEVGRGKPVFFIGEAGINHNGSVEIALALVKAAAEAGCHAIKFQKRDPDISTPEKQKSVVRETPWGQMSYLEYKKKIEFWDEEYSAIATSASEAGIDWFASPWDLPSVEFLEKHDVFAYKIASASVTDHDLLREIAITGKPVILSTGMSTLEEIDRAVEILGTKKLVLMQATSTYPMNPAEANLRAIKTLQDRYGVDVGYSGHETGLQVSLAAVALGAVAIERHLTLDRAMWGTDQAASLEPAGMSKLIRDSKLIELALGDGIKTVYVSETEPREKLRRIK